MRAGKRSLMRAGERSLMRARPLKWSNGSDARDLNPTRLPSVLGEGSQGTSLDPDYHKSYVILSIATVKHQFGKWWI